MTKRSFSSQLKYYLLTHTKKPPEGFSFIEALIAIAILSIAFTINLQLFLLLKIQNVEQKVTTGAVSLSKEVLEGIRFQTRSDVEGKLEFRTTTVGETPVEKEIANPGETEIKPEDFSDERRLEFGGFNYTVIVNVCTNSPTPEEQEKDTLNDLISKCQSDASEKNQRSIIVRVKYPKLIKYEYDKNTKQENIATEEQVYHAETATFTKLRGR